MINQSDWNVFLGGDLARMVQIEKVEGVARSQVRRFIDVPFRILQDCPQWVPPLKRELAKVLDRRAHPFYETSDAAFFLAKRGQQDVGRIAVLNNRPLNNHQQRNEANFYFFDCEDDPEVSASLFDAALEWAHSQGLTEMVGPKGFTPFDPYGILVDGFEHRQLMSMVAYNHPYYARLLEQCGFGKSVDFVSFYLCRDTFHISDRVKRVAARVKRRGILRVRNFGSKRELLRWVEPMNEAYSRSFNKNWEFYPLSRRQFEFIAQSLGPLLDHRLVKILTYKDQVAGFLLAFPDVSAALQKCRGGLLPLGLLRILRERQRTEWVAVNGAGVLPEFHGCGANALLYEEAANSLMEAGFRYAHLTQIAETAVEMRHDLQELGAIPFKTHRVYTRSC